MYKLKKNNTTVLLGPLPECVKRLKQECTPQTTVQELSSKGWVIEPASQGLIRCLKS